MAKRVRQLRLYEQALIIHREVGYRRGEGAALGDLATAHAKVGEMPKAIEFYKQRLLIARDIGDRRGEGIASFNLALVLDELGERKKAIAHAEVAVKIFEQIEDPKARMVRQQLTKWKGG